MFANDRPRMKLEYDSMHAWEHEEKHDDAIN